MSDIVKSALVPGQNGKEEFGKKPEIQYTQTNPNEAFGQLSDEEKEAEFNRIHEEYIHTKMDRKEEMIKLKKEEFGSSSSSDSRSEGEEKQLEKEVKKVETKRSKGNQQLKQEIKQQIKQQKAEQAELNSYSVILQLQKSTIETELVFMQKQFQINKRLIPFIVIHKVVITAPDFKTKMGQKLTIGSGGDEIILTINEKKDNKARLKELFMRLCEIKLDVKTAKFPQNESRVNLQEFGQLKEGALIYDKIYKKSQILGKWQQRYVVLRNEGVNSHRKVNQKASMSIATKDVLQFQTNFQIFKQLLVVKLIYSGDKTDFGVPLDAKLSWLLAFLKLIQ